MTPPTQLKTPSRLSRHVPLETHAASRPAPRRTSAVSAPSTPRFTRQQPLKLSTPTRYGDRGPDMDQLPELSPAPAAPHRVSPLPSPMNRGPAPGSRLAALRKARAESAAASAANGSVNSSDDSTDLAPVARPTISRTTRPSLEPPSRLSCVRSTRTSIDPPSRLGSSRNVEESSSATPRRTGRPSLGTPSKRTPHRSATETPRRSTRASLEPRTPQRRTTPAKAPPTLTPSQQKQEAARKRREAAEAATEEAKRSTQSSRRRATASYRAKTDEAPSLRTSKSYRVNTEEQPPLRSAASYHSQLLEQPRLRQSASYRSQPTDEPSRLQASASCRLRTEKSSFPRAATAYQAISDDSSDLRSVSAHRNNSDETSTPRTAAARARFLDRGYTGAVPAASTNAGPAPRRRLTGGGDTPNRLKRASQMRAQRPSLPVEGVPVSRRLDVSGDSETGSTLPARNKTLRSRAEAMNAIAASTLGSHRLDTTDLVADAAPVIPPPAQLETVVPRTPGKHRGALESFRRTRRASQEAEAARRASLEAEAARRGSVDSEASRRTLVDPEIVAEDDGIIVVDKLEDRSEPGGGLAETWRTSTARVDGTKLLSVEILSDESPASASPALRSGRFSDAGAGSGSSLGGAARLRESLGRRRSRGTQDLSSIAPPQLRRRSLKLGEHKPLSVGLARLSMGDGGGREPLGSVDRGRGVGNTNSTSSGREELRGSRLKGFKLGDDQMTWADDAAGEELFKP